MILKGGSVLRGIELIMANRHSRRNTNKPVQRKKNVVLQVLVLIVAIALLAGIIIMPFHSFAITANAEDNGVSLVVESFEKGKLADAISEAADGTDYNHITNIAVLSGTLSASDYQALTNIPNLKNIELAGCETEDGVIPEYALPSRNQLTYLSLPKNTEEIGEKAFNNNKKLVKVSMPDSVKIIGNYAFEACEALADIPVTENVTYIGEGAFRDCKAITEFTIPSNITEIYAYTFSKCGFSEIIIGPNVKSIGDGAFSDCNNLKDIYVYAENAPSISGSGVFQNVGATIHVYEDSAESYKKWEGNNIKAAGDLTGDYPVVTAAQTEAAETEAEPVETEAPVTASEEREEGKSEETAAPVSEEKEEATTSEETAVQTSAEEKDGPNIVLLVIIVAAVGAAAGFGGAAVFSKMKNR